MTTVTHLAHSTVTIAKREFGGYFKSPIAYIVLTVFLGLTGFLFFDRFFVAGDASMAAFFGNMPLILLFFGPAMAMRLLAEERGSGTIELLLPMPVRDWEVVLGKYLAALGLLAAGLALTLPFAITVGKLGPLDTGPVIGGYLGTLFLGGTYLAIGLSVLAHGLTAAPLANRYADWYESHPRDGLPALESSEVRDVRWRFGLGHSRTPGLTGRG